MIRYLGRYTKCKPSFTQCAAKLNGRHVNNPLLRTCVLLIYALGRAFGENDAGGLRERWFSATSGGPLWPQPPTVRCSAIAMLAINYRTSGCARSAANARLGRLDGDRKRYTPQFKHCFDEPTWLRRIESHGSNAGAYT